MEGPRGRRRKSGRSRDNPCGSFAGGGLWSVRVTESLGYTELQVQCSRSGNENSSDSER